MTSNGKQLHYVSERLRKMSRWLSEARHGGVVLAGDQLEGVIQEVDTLLQHSLDLEGALSVDMWNRRAAEDRAKLMTPGSVVVLEAFRTNSNVVTFPGRPSPFDGSAA
ncbi:hypothetical protein [Rhizobium ruizarguesonis]|uniref:hypothetical protein n=1 Tax=Rhizobium ruizarguesonis TaxID=2081791 RepID=UPI00102F64C2|nr:hypothetical protein [Rhizobium ruizarguesonis]TAZ57852.1 hypothetical protein ELH71_16370 [Rhizobium ruizarguesonis]